MIHLPCTPFFTEPMPLQGYSQRMDKVVNLTFAGVIALGVGLGMILAGFLPFAGYVVTAIGGALTQVALIAFGVRLGNAD